MKLKSYGKKKKKVNRVSWKADIRELGCHAILIFYKIH